MSQTAIAVELSVEPAKVTGGAELDIRGAVRNLGTEVVDTRVHASRLLVNGEPSDTWSWAIANGIRDERELALPPGEQVRFQRKLPASSVLRRPGRYELVLDVLGVKSNPVMVEWQEESR